MSKFMRELRCRVAAEYKWSLWTGGNDDEVAAFLGVTLLPYGPGEQVQVRAGQVLIRTLEGEMRADPDDWIIKGIKGEFYPCKPDIFEQTYEPVDDDGTVCAWPSEAQ